MLAPETVLQHRYSIGACIGRGGMGAVYEAHDRRLGITVAVKELLNSSEQLLRAFEREARTLAALSHQALPRVTDYFEHEGSYYLVMEHLPGPDFDAFLNRRSTPFTLSEVLGWADQLLDVLAYLHRREPPVLHRDIKPHNLKLNGEGRLVLLDFGLARGVSMPGQSLVGYTLNYAPPEQIRGETTDPRSDLYAAGATFYHMLTRSRPPDAIRRQAALSETGSDLLRPLELQNPLVPAPVAALIAAAMALRPEDRPASAEALRRSLRAAVPLDETEAPTEVVAAPLRATEATPAASAPGQDARPPTAPASSTPAGSSLRTDSSSANAVVTLLFTDVAGSTRLWEHFPGEMPDAIARHNELLQAACASNRGLVFKYTGDGICAVFADPVDALVAAIAGQRALAAASFDPLPGLKARMGLHTGVVHMRRDDYYGQPLNRVARLMEAGHGGQILVSGATQLQIRELLPSAVSLRAMGEHRLRDLTNPEQIFQVVAPGLDEGFPPLRTLNSRLTNLPAQPTALVGREDDVTAVRELLLRPDVRLVTLSGPGGTGKTRLGLQVAADLLDEFEHGVFFVDLAAVRTPELLLATTARALDLSEADAETPLALLKQHLAARKLLLVLDNFEQIVIAAPLLAELAAAAPRVKVLVTSRAPLRIAGEHEYAVHPLAIPDLRRLKARGVNVVATLLQSPSVALFVARAQAVNRGFALTSENAPAVAGICVRLDGLPLAIELAAARVKVLSPRALLARLDQRLKLLEGGQQTTPRQKTLRATIDWSYELLEPAERELFARLGVFVGGCSFEAAEELCADPDGELDTLDGLEALVNKSLLRNLELSDGEPRFVMLETLREYARERLGAGGAGDELAERHALYYLGLAERAETELGGAEQATWLDRLEEDHANLRAAMRWLLDHGRGDELARMAAALWVFWHIRGYLSEGSAWLQEAIAVASAEPRIRARVLNGAGTIAWTQGRYVQAAALCEEALACARAADDRLGAADALFYLGVIAKVRGQLERAVGYYEESREMYLAIGNKRWAAMALNNLGVVAEETGDYAQAQRYYEENLRLYRTLGNELGMADTQINLGFVVLYLGELPRADELFRDGLRIHRRLGDQCGVAYALMGLAQVALARQTWPVAVSQATEALWLFAENEEREGELRSLAVLAEVAAAQDHLEGSAKVWGAVQARCAELGCVLTQREQAAYERARTAAHTTLGEARANELEHQGELLTNEQLAALFERAHEV